MRTILYFSALLLFSLHLAAQPKPWKKEQVMPTSELAAKLTGDLKGAPLVINVGPMENIKTALKTGPANTLAGIEKLKTTVANVEKNKEIVIYCGCCSFDNCGNVIPAFQELVDLGYTKVKVLEIPEGFRPDWAAKDYPVE